MLVCPAVMAQEGSKKDQAREFYQHGINLYEKGDAEAAAEAFREAYKMRPSWKILFNIGQCEAAAGRYGLSMEAFQQYLVDGKDEIPVERKDYVLEEMDRIQKLVGELEIEAPDGSAVYVDGVHRGTTPMTRPVMVVGGKDHELKVILDSETILEQTVSVWGQKKKKITAEKKAEAQPAVAQPEPEQEAEEPEESTEEEPERLWTWVSFGIGGAAAIGAAVTGGLVLSGKSDITSECEDKVCPEDRKGDADSIETMALVTDVLIGVAALGVAAGTVLYFFEPEWMGESDVQVGPSVSDGQAGILIQGRF